MLELDLWLGGHLERVAADLTPEDLRLWQQLLAHADAVLLEWLQGVSEPPAELLPLFKALGRPGAAVLTSGASYTNPE